MKQHLLLIPTLGGVGLTTISLGLIRAFERLGVHAEFVKPIAQLRPGDTGPERSTAWIRATTHLHPPEPIPLRQVEEALRTQQEQRLLEEVVARVQSVSEQAEVVVIEGLVPTDEVPFGDQLNAQIATALDAEVVLVGSVRDTGPRGVVDAFALAASVFPSGKVAGCILNRVPEPGEEGRPDEAAYHAAMTQAGFGVVGAVPYRRDFAAPRIRDVARGLGVEVLHAGDDMRRMLSFSVAAMTVPNCLVAIQPGSLVVTPGDRNDVIMATALAALGGVRVAGLLLTGGLRPDPRVMQLCTRALQLGLPVLLASCGTLQAAQALLRLDPEVPLDDAERIELVMRAVADHIDQTWVQRMRRSDRPRRLTAPAFRYQLLERSKAAHKRIVLPEGDEPRTIEAAAQCEARGIAHCILLGNDTKVRHVAADRGITLPPTLEILDPGALVERYVEPMVALRKHKGLTQAEAENALGDPIVVGTMMLAMGHVDGLVSGAVHTTAHTVRPALQLIRTAASASLVSSVFFMCLPDQVLVYGDCAINPDPTAEELADIALQSADSAAAFGIEPRVALISYSTGASGRGADVDKVRRATEIARARRPDLLLDGPLQYDAAVMPSVAAEKAPKSAVAGRASVLIFPDLNTGNTTYKAVQRSAHVVSIGPMLQGLAKPVNDLSRGALVEDIVYTIALTAIQAQHAT